MEIQSVWKWASLLAFMLQNSVNPIIFRYATTESAAAERASTVVVVFFTETFKLFTSFSLLSIEEGFSPIKAGGVVHRDWLQMPRESLSLAVPAIIYAIQNVLLQWSSGHLSAALWQVVYQGKILVTAGFSVLLLRKQIKRAQWLAIAIMGGGIAIVQLSDSKETKKASMGNAAEQNVAWGLVMLLLACCCSGFASIYTEMVFKQVGSASAQKKKSVWLQNMQLALFSMIITLGSFALEKAFPAPGAGGSKSFLTGFTAKTWALTVNNTVGGLLVALVIKHADNILRGFASAIATINAALISVVAFGFVLKMSFGLGTLMVVGSTLLYGSVLKLPGEWWNSECALCSAPRAVESYEAPSEGAAAAAPHDSEVELATMIGAVHESKT